MQQYVVGFLFDEEATLVALIKKNRPSWQQGKLNGIGGKIDPGEFPAEAIHREFIEETGVEINNWTRIVLLDAPHYNLHIFVSRSNLLFNVKTITDEHVGIYPVSEINRMNVIPNLRWLIPFAIHYNNDLILPITVYESGLEEGQIVGK